MKSMLQNRMYSSEDSSDDGEILNMDSYPVQPDNSFISDCVGIPREQWSKKEVTLMNGEGVLVAIAIVEFTSPFASPDGIGPLNEEFVGVVICDVLMEDPRIVVHTLVRRAIYQALYEGVSLYNHGRQNHILIATSLRSHSGLRQYNSSRTRRPRQNPLKKDRVLDDDVVIAAMHAGCCSRKCVSKFTHTQILALRHKMYHSNFKTKQMLKLNVHRAFHICSRTSGKLTVVEGAIVCMRAWHIIYDVLRLDFYRYAALARQGHRAQSHQGRRRVHHNAAIVQAVQTLDMLLKSKADAMPHKTYTIPNGKKVVQKVLPCGTQWKKLAMEVNVVSVEYGDC